MDALQILVLALVQGLTEFLPISSSAHLILVPHLFGFADQGLAFDVAVHLGSLLAVVLYFRHLLWAVVRDTLGHWSGRAPASGNSHLGMAIVLATLPGAGQIVEPFGGLAFGAQMVLDRFGLDGNRWRR